jgi:GntR family transcriptional regulator
MTENLPVQNPPLADQVYDIILKSILSGEYKGGSKLPSENELADLYNVSRPTIRTAFSRLGELGYVIRKRGVGTFVSNTPSIANPLYQSIDVMDRISTQGFKPGFKQLGAEIITADQELAEKLDVAADSKLVHIQKLFTADEEPIIFFENFIPAWVYQDHFSNEEILQPGITEPFFEFFAHHCKQEVNLLNSVIHPDLVENCDLPREFNDLAPHTPVLSVIDLGYSTNNEVLFVSHELLFKDASNFYVVRPVGRV